MMTISVRFNEEEAKLLKAYAAMNHISVSELIRQTLAERMEEEYDLELYQQAMAEYQENPVTYSLEDVEKELGLR